MQIALAVVCLAVPAQENILEQWRRVAELAPRYTVGGKQTGNGGAVTRHTSVDGAFSVTRVVAGEQFTVGITNDKYAARLESPDGKTWHLSKLSLNSDTGEQAALSDAQAARFFEETVLNPTLSPGGPTIQDLLANSSPAETKASGTAVLLDFSARPEKDVAGNLIPRAIRLTANLENSFPVSQYEITAKLPVPDGEVASVFRQQRKYSGFEEVGTVILPTIVETRIAVGVDEPFPAAPGQRLELDYSNFTSPLNHDHCFLAHYGLPEPKIPKSYTWVYVGLAILFFAGYLLYRRGTKA